MSQIIRITSEALQATVRRLLPSQQGFGEDLQASNVITPIIDLTPTAEGSALPLQLSSAAAFGNGSYFEANNATVTVANTAGFHSVQFSYNIRTNVAEVVALVLTDGLGTKTVWEVSNTANSAQTSVLGQYGFTFFLDSGESMTASSSSTAAFLQGYSRQIADKQGNIVNPAGFSFE